MSARTVRPILGEADDGHAVDIPLTGLVAPIPVLITGQSGSGKTVLLDQISRALPDASVCRRSLRDDPTPAAPHDGVDVLMLDDADDAFAARPQAWLSQLHELKRSGGVTIAVTQSLNVGHFGRHEPLRSWLLGGTVIRFAHHNLWDVQHERVVDLTRLQTGECYVQTPADDTPVRTTVPAPVRA